MGVDEDWSENVQSRVNQLESELLANPDLLDPRNKSKKHQESRISKHKKFNKLSTRIKPKDIKRSKSK